MLQDARMTAMRKLRCGIVQSGECLLWADLVYPVVTVAIDGYVVRSGRIKMARGLSKWQIPLLTVVDRGGRRLFSPIANRQNRTIEIALAPIVPDDAVLCSDGLKPYRAFCKKHGLTHYEVSNKSGQRVVAGAFHIQNVNALHSRYDAFIRPFCGPATKYLYRYLRWFLLRTRSPRKPLSRVLWRHLDHEQEHSQHGIATRLKFYVASSLLLGGSWSDVSISGQRSPFRMRKPLLRVFLRSSREWRRFSWCVTQPCMGRDDLPHSIPPRR